MKSDKLEGLLATIMKQRILAGDAVWVDAVIENRRIYGQVLSVKGEWVQTHSGPFAGRWSSTRVTFTKQYGSSQGTTPEVFSIKDVEFDEHYTMRKIDGRFVVGEREAVVEGMRKTPLFYGMLKRLLAKGETVKTVSMLGSEYRKYDCIVSEPVTDSYGVITVRIAYDDDGETYQDDIGFDFGEAEQLMLKKKGDVWWIENAEKIEEAVDKKPLIVTMLLKLIDKIDAQPDGVDDIQLSIRYGHSLYPWYDINEMSRMPLEDGTLASGLRIATSGKVKTHGARNPGGPILKLSFQNLEDNYTLRKLKDNHWVLERR